MQKSLYAFLICTITLFEPTLVCAKEISVMTWNIQVGQNKGLAQNNWPARKSLVQKQLVDAKADIYCLQEVSPDQKAFIAKSLGDFAQFGAGRDDGKNIGEHCLILFKKELFELSNGETFWLSDTPETCKNTWDFPFKRICTWVSFTDKKSDKKLFVFNTHFPLNPLVQEKAAMLLKERIKKVTNSQTKPLVVICGDFNCDNKSKAWKILQDAGFKPISNAKSITVMGKLVACTDTIFISKDIKATETRLHLLRSKTGTCASDHQSIETKLSF